MNSKKIKDFIVNLKKLIIKYYVYIISAIILYDAFLIYKRFSKTQLFSQKDEEVTSVPNEKEVTNIPDEKSNRFKDIFNLF